MIFDLFDYSFGLLHRYLAGGAELPPLAGAALLCSAPPSGNGALVGRLMRQAPLLAARLTWRAHRVGLAALKLF